MSCVEWLTLTPKKPPPNTVDGLGLGPCPDAARARPVVVVVVGGTPNPPAAVAAPVAPGVGGLVRNERGVEPPEEDGPPIAPRPPPKILAPAGRDIDEI